MEKMPKKGLAAKSKLQKAKTSDFTKGSSPNSVQSHSNNQNTTGPGDNPNIASICHKKSYGANNWQVFLGTGKKLVPNQTETRKLQNKSNHHNKLNRTTPLGLHNVSKHSKSNPKTTIEIPSKSSNTSLKKSCINDLKCVKDELVAIQDEIKHQSQAERKSLTKHIAMDCEMVGVEIGVKNSMLARVSLVNSFGECVYDKFVKPTEPVLDYRTHVSGVRPENLENGEDFKTVQKEVYDILKGRILVGHALKNDLRVLFLTHPKQAIRDTSKYKKLREKEFWRIISLKKLAMKYLGVSIQEGEHCSIQDALAAMQLYKMFKKEWEASLKAKSFKIKKKEVLTSKSALMMDS